MDRHERRRRARELLDILSECEDELFQSFCDALITDGQSLIADSYLRRDKTDDQRRRRQLRERRRDQGNSSPSYIQIRLLWYKKCTV